MAKIVAYQVQNDGNWDPVTFSKDKMKPHEVFIFVNDVKKSLWIWIGQQANVRTRFISSTVAQEIRRLYGLTLRVRSADQGSEPDDFWDCIEAIPPEGLGPEALTTQSVKLKDAAKQSAKKLKKPAKSTKKASKRGTKTKTTIKKSAVKSAMKSKPLNDYIKSDTSVVTTPPCPKCKKGHLIPLSQVVKVTTRRKGILPFAKWVCSNCEFSPTESESDL